MSDHCERGGSTPKWERLWKDDTRCQVVVQIDSNNACSDTRVDVLETGTVWNEVDQC